MKEMARDGEAHKYKIGLVLEGGGMRSVFTAGVCDALLDYGVAFPYVIGTSAGATSGCIYLAKQRGRSHFINIDLHRVRPYIGLRSVLRGKGVIDMDFIFNEVPRDYYPFDFKTYSESASRMVMVSTSAITGKAVYSEEKVDFDRFVDACRSSCTLPLMCPTWHIDGEPMVDGGVGDAIPFAKALADGCERVVVVSTKDAQFRKSERPMLVPWPLYRQYPELLKALAVYGKRYNEQVDELSALEREGRAIVVRPRELFGVTRTTQDTERLEALYAEGLRQGKELVKKLSTWQN